MKITYGIFIGVIIILFTLLVVRIVNPDSFDREKRIVNDEKTNTENRPITQKTPENEEVESNSSKPEIASGTYTNSIQHQGVRRNYIIHIPEGYNPNNNYPLVFLLHGGGGSGEQILSSTQLSSNADNNGYILVVPDGIDGNWNDGRERSNTISTTADDVDFIITLIDHLNETYAIDKNKVYSTGISNGGSMTQRLACETSNTFAAIAPLASPMKDSFVATCNNPEPIPVLGIQGSEDPFHPIYDDDGIPELPRILKRQGIQQEPLEVEEITEFWPMVNGCTNEPNVRNLPQTVSDGTQPTEYAFRNCQSGKPVIYYIVYGMGHSWPGGDKAANLENISGPSSQNLDANQVIWEFFNQHSL